MSGVKQGPVLIKLTDQVKMPNDIASGEQAATKDLGIDGVDIGRDYAMICTEP